MAVFMMFLDEDDFYGKCVTRISKNNKKIDIIIRGIGDDEDDVDSSAIQFSSVQAMRDFRDYLSDVILEEEEV